MYQIKYCVSKKITDRLLNDRYTYRMNDDFVGVEDKESVKYRYVYIPFPIAKIETNMTLVDEEVKLKCSFEQLKMYYENMSSAKIYDNKIEVTANDADDKYVRITYLDNNKIQFELESKNQNIILSKRNRKTESRLIVFILHYYKTNH